MSTTTVMTPVDCLAAAIRQRLPHGERWSVRPVADHNAVEVACGTARPGAVVLAAVTDDANTPAVLTHARRRALELNARLRVVHVWTGRGREVGGVHLPPRYPPDADLMLSAKLYEHLTPAEAASAERQILHDPDPGRALRALSRDAALLVVGTASDAVTSARPFGDTVSGLIGRTACPLAVALPQRIAVPSW